MTLSVELIRELCKKRRIKWSHHAVARYQERDISRNEILQCIEHGEVIEEYPADYPTPSCLILHIVISKALHVVVGHDDKFIYIITAYRPDPEKWTNGFRERKVQDNVFLL